MDSYKYTELDELVGKTIKEISRNKKGEDDRIFVQTTDGKTYAMFLSQDCCESVSIYDIKGELESLIGSPLTIVEQKTSEKWPKDVAAHEYTPESFTWTWFTLKTAKSKKVIIRWLGESNGWYSEGVNFEELT